MAGTSKTTNEELLQLLHGLIDNWEHEVVEFKQATNNQKHHEIGQYFSAISNEANLKGLKYGWFILGIENKTRKIIGTNYRDTHGLEVLKYEIAKNTTGGMTFLDIYEVYEGKFRVVMMKIPAAITGTPTAWKGHWYGRDGESLGPLSQDELDRIRGQSRFDWSRQIIENSNISHLSKEAIAKAREDYKTKQNREHISAEVDGMTDEEFLLKLNLTVNGKLTNTAMILLGNPDHEYIMDTPVSVMWRLYDSRDMPKDYMEFRVPFITVVDRVYEKVRNLTYRYIPNRKSLQTYDIPRYDINLQRELLFNSIAHMDYTQGNRIYVDEYDDYFLVQNPGTFIPGDILPILQPWYTAPYYRNKLLADTMASLNMIDSIAWGIRKVFRIQQERYFPMPDYYMMKPDKVVVRVFGKTLDENYMRLLYDHPEYDLETVYLLDCVQKKQPLHKEQYKYLRSLGVIEGKVPNVYISSMMSEVVEAWEQDKRKITDSIGDSIGENIGENDKQRQIVELMKQKPKISAREIGLKINIASRNVEAYIKALKDSGQIDRVGSAKGGHWVVLHNDIEDD